MSVAVNRNYQDNLPSIGLLALASTLAVYILSLSESYRPPLYITGTILLCGGCLQLLIGIWSQKHGCVSSARALLPLGIFWLSLISYEIFPAMGLGQHPNSVTMFSFMSLWSFFLAFLFLGSFRQNVAIKTLYGFMMFSFAALAMDHLKSDNVFLLVGCGTGILASLVALYIVLAQNYNRLAGRKVLPLGEWSHSDGAKDES